MMPETLPNRMDPIVIEIPDMDEGSSINIKHLQNMKIDEPAIDFSFPGHPGDETQTAMSATSIPPFSLLKLPNRGPNRVDLDAIFGAFIIQDRSPEKK